MGQAIRMGCGAWSEVRGDGERSDVVLAYLHGFSGSPGDIGQTLHQIREQSDLALLAGRLRGHGEINRDALGGVTSKDWVRDAEALLDRAAGMGRRVVLCGTSLGGLMALRLAARYVDLVTAVIVWSPAVAPRDWTRLDAMASLDPGVIDVAGERNEGHEAYWARALHTDGYRALRRALADWGKSDALDGIRCPVFIGIEENDQIADVDAMAELAVDIGRWAPTTTVRFVGGAHALASPYRSAIASDVAARSRQFLGDIGVLS